MEKEIKSARKRIRTHLKAREFKEALSVCQEIISKDVRSAEMYTMQGMCLFYLEEPLRAMESYEEALEIDKDCLDALKGVCQCLLDMDESKGSHQAKLSSFSRLCSLDPDYKFCNRYKKEICLSHWKVAEYELSFDAFKSLIPDYKKEVLQFMFSEVNKTESLICYHHLHDMLENNEALLPTDGKMRFYYEYGSYLNEQGQDPSSLIEKMIFNLDHYRQILIVDSVGSSVGSDDVGIPIIPTSAEWWPSKTLAAQLWMIWHQNKDWNGSPKLPICEEILCSLSDTAVILRKDQCTAKTISHLLQYFDCDKFEDVTELCDDDQLNIYSQYDNTCQFNVVKMFLRDVANATIRKNVEKLPESLEMIEDILRKRPTFQNQSLLKLVVRFRCYVTYTYNIPTSLDYIKECGVQDPIISAWSALIENKIDFLTCEDRHPMVDVVKQYIAEGSGRHVNLEKLLSIWKSHHKNFTYSTLILKVLKNQVEDGKFEIKMFEEMVNQCYCNDKKNPTVLFFFGDIYKTQHKDHYEAARYFEKSIKLGGGLDVLKHIDSLPLTDDGVKELIVKSLKHILLKTPMDPKLHIRMAMLHWDESEAAIAIKHLQKALEISKEPLTMELLGEKYLSVGKFRSAYNTYVKAYEMESTPYRQYSVGSILLQRGYPSEALAEFEKLLENNSSYGPGILGCVKSLYQLAVNSVLKEARPRYLYAVELANNCVQYLDQLLSFEPKWSSAWKYLGDICLFILQLRDSTLNLTEKIKSALSVGETEFSGQNLAHLAVKSYNRGLELEPSCSEYLIDLTRSYLELAKYQGEYLLHALTLSKRSVQLRPHDHIAWNLLGAVCIKQKVYSLAQHACIKSLNIDKDDNPVAWTNLGLLYMLNKEYTLSNQCYSEAQSNDPKYAQCWVAMAYLARAMGYEGEAEKIFKDLVQDRERKSTVEGTLEYAVNFCHSDMTSEMMHEVLTLTTRCSHLQHPADWLLFNISGVLSEKLHLNKVALQNYIKAQTLSPTPEVRAELQQNIERVQCKLGNYSAMNQNKHNLWLALAHMRRGQYGMASSILDSIGEEDGTVSKADVAVFQAVLCWLSRDTKSISSYLENPNSDNAQLLRCLMLSEEPPQDLRDSINCDDKTSDVQTKFACLSLKLFNESENFSSVDLSELLTKTNAIPIVSTDSQYLFAKYLVIRKLDLAKARMILDRCISSGSLKEDIFELYVEVLVCGDNPADDADNAGVDNANLVAEDIEVEKIQTEIKKKRDYLIKKYTQRSYHMFPWRHNSKTLFQRYCNAP